MAAPADPGFVPTFFAENPRQWFQTAEAQFATARPAPNNGQKYFHLLQKLPAEIMNNCSDIITTCTLAASSNSGDPYTAMKSAILDYTQKPKWSCYMDLHSLPPQGDIRPSQLMAKLINTLPHGTDTKTDLFYSFLCLECLSISASCWPRVSTPPPARWQSPPTASGTCANQLPPPPPQHTDPASGPRHHTNTAATPTAAATPAAPPTAAARRAAAAAGPRRPMTRNFQITAPVGTTGNIRTAQSAVGHLAIGTAPMPGRETASPPARAHGPSGRRPQRKGMATESHSTVPLILSPQISLVQTNQKPSR